MDVTTERLADGADPRTTARPAGRESQDALLLRRWVSERDEAAFAAIVRRHVGAVHASAVRRTGDGHAADDVTQAVFLLLSTRADAAAASVGRGAPLVGWLLRATGYLAANANRSSVAYCLRPEQT